MTTKVRTAAAEELLSIAGLSFDERKQIQDGHLSEAAEALRKRFQRSVKVMVTLTASMVTLLLACGFWAADALLPLALLTLMCAAMTFNLRREMLSRIEVLDMVESRLANGRVAA